MPYLALFAIVAWITLYLLVLRPRLESFRLTAGIYRKIDAAEASVATRVRLRLSGAKVAIVGVLTSALPVVAPAIAQVYALNWAQFFPGDQAGLYGFVFSILGIVGPMIMTALHGTALDAAAKIDPKA